MKDRREERDVAIATPAPAAPVRAPALAPVPELIMMSCDDNLVFENENLGRIWRAEPQLWHSNDNRTWSTDIAG